MATPRDNAADSGPRSDTPAWRLADIMPTFVVPLIVAILTSATVSLLAKSETVARLEERIINLENAVNDLKSDQVASSTLQSLFTTYQNDIVALKAKTESLCDTTAQLRALSTAAGSLPSDVASLRERIASVETRLEGGSGSQ